MGDWLHVHHCLVCRDHATALRVYERIEQAGERIEEDGGGGPTGILWGFWDPRVILLSTTRKWGSSPGFAQPLVDGLSADCFTASDDEDVASSHAAFQKAVRARLGARRDFLWSDKPEVMKVLLAELEPLDTGLTKLALLPPRRKRAALSVSAAAALAPHAYAAVVHGFLSHGDGCFALGAFSSGEAKQWPSPLWTPLAAVRGFGRSAWALHTLLDGNERMPVHGVDAADLWRMERHGAHGSWQPRDQRLARAQTLLESAVAEDRQAGCALARRWWLPEHMSKVASLRDDVDEHVRAAAEFALQTLRVGTPLTRCEVIADPWLGLAAADEGRDQAKALALIEDPDVGGAARWVAASLEDIDLHATLVVEACSNLAEVSTAFADAWADDELGRVFLLRLGELAYAATRTSYWMVRYGVPGRDSPASVHALDLRPAWTGETGPSAARIIFWAARTIEASATPFSRRTLLQGFVAFDELLAAVRVNGSWWMPPVGAIHADLVTLLAKERQVVDIGTAPPGNEELSRLNAQASEISGLLQTARADGTATETLIGTCIQALRGIADLPLAVDPFSQYGRQAPRLISWIANNLAWQLLLAAELARALSYAELAVRYGDWRDDAPRDTLARVLIALGRTREAHTLVRWALRRNPASAAFGELAAVVM